MKSIVLLTMISSLCLAKGDSRRRLRDDNVYVTFDDDEFIFEDEPSVSRRSQNDEINQFIILGDDEYIDWEDDDSHYFFNVIERPAQPTTRPPKPTPRSRSIVTEREKREFEEFRTEEDFLEDFEDEFEEESRTLDDFRGRRGERREFRKEEKNIEENIIEDEGATEGDYWTSYDPEDNSYDVPNRYKLPEPAGRPSPIRK